MNGILSVILAVKDPDDRLLNWCLCSLSSLENARNIDLVLVVSGGLPDLRARYESAFASLRVVRTPPAGVYSAFNVGLDQELAEYVLFLGVDDLVLPGLDRVLSSIQASSQRPDIIASRAWMQDRGISGPSRVRGALIFRNWCQQSILYHSRLFVSRRFNPKYKVQADHQLNLELLANRKLRIQYGADVIAHFSSGGLTSRVTDWGFRDDMPALVRRDYGSFYWLLALARRKLGDLFKGRPKQRKEERTKDR